MPKPTPKTARPLWPVLTLVTAGMGAGPLLNFGLAGTSALVITTFGLTSAQFGLILTCIYASAALMSLVLGWLADRLPPRAQWAILFGGAVIALGLAGIAPSYGFLLATAVFSGLSQAMSNPTTNRAVTAIAPPNKRIGWIGIKQSGVQGAQLVSGLAFPPLTLWIGWEGAALTMSGLCVVLLIGAVTLIPDWTKGPSGLTETSPTPVFSPRSSDAARRERSDRADASAAVIDSAGEQPVPDAVAGHEHRATDAVTQPEHPALADAARPSTPSRPPAPPAGPSPRMIWLIVGLLASVSFLSAFGLMSTNGYLALFAVQQFEYPLVVGGLVVAAGGLIGLASRIWWAQALVRGAGAGPLLVIMSAGAIAAAACLTISALAHIGALVWVGVVLHGVSVLGASVVINASVIKVASKRMLGLATGVTATGLYAGFATGPFVAGAVIDTDAGFVGGWVVVGIAYVACLAVSIVFSRVTRHLRRASRAAGLAAPAAG
ncbi:MAG: MFS transporter [Pseudoclavibacter sp.]